MAVVIRVGPPMLPVLHRHSLVVRGAVSGDDLEAKLSEMLQSGATPSDAARRAAKELGARKKEAYALALRLAGKQ